MTESGKQNNRKIYVRPEITMPIDPMNDPRSKIGQWVPPVTPMPPRALAKGSVDADAEDFGFRKNLFAPSKDSANPSKLGGESGLVFNRELLLKFLQSLADAAKKITYSDVYFTIYPGSKKVLEAELSDFYKDKFALKTLMQPDKTATPAQIEQYNIDKAKMDQTKEVLNKKVKADVEHHAEEGGVKLLNTLSTPELSVVVSRPDGSYNPSVNIDEEWASVAKTWPVINAQSDGASGADVASRWLRLANASKGITGEFKASVSDVLNAVKQEADAQKALENQPTIDGQFDVKSSVGDGGQLEFANDEGRSWADQFYSLGALSPDLPSHLI